MDKYIYDYTKKEEKQLNSLYTKLMNSEWKDHDRRLVLITFLFYMVRFEERDVENPITSKQDLFHHIYIKLESMRQVNVRLRVLKVMEETFKDISFFDVTFKVLIDGMRELIHGVSDFKVDRYLEYLYLKEAKTIKEQKGGGVVFTPLSVSYFIETFIHQYLGDSLNQKEMKILEPCIGTGQLSSVFRREKYHLDGVEIDDDNLTITVLKTWLFNSDQEQVYTYDFLNQNKDDDVLLDVRYDVGICNPPYSSLVNRNDGKYKKVAVNELEFIERLCERVDGLVFALVPYYCINPPKSKTALKQSFDRLRYDYLLVSLVFFTRDIFYPSAMVDTVLMVFDTRHRGIVGKALEDGDRVYLDPIRIVLDDVDFTDIHRNRKKVWTHWCDWLETFNLDVWSNLKLARHPDVNVN